MRKNVYDPASALAIWAAFEPLLGKKAASLFNRKTLKPHCLFVNRVVRPSLYDLERQTYVPVTETVRTPGRNHEWASTLFHQPDFRDEGGVDNLQLMPYFANELRIDFGIDDGSVHRFAPSERVSLGCYHVFTLEFDVPSVDFFQRQLTWVTPRKNPLECPIGTFYAACSAYADFAGITVIYGGHKSLHIHVVFDTAPADTILSLSARQPVELRRGFIALWERLHTVFLSLVDTGGHSADRQLRFPEQYRRLPFGLRTIDFDNHLLSIPKGTDVVQLPLWERFRNRAGGDELPLFFSAECLAPAPEEALRSVRRYRAGKIGDMSPSQLAYCEAKLRALYGGWPRFAALGRQGDKWVARFYNSESDRTPSSIMREDFQTIAAIGHDAHQAKARRLPFPLGSMLRLWCEQMPGAALVPLVEAELDDEGKLIRSLEVHFGEEVCDNTSAYAAMSHCLGKMVPRRGWLMVVGPEGIGKTTTMFAQYHLYARWLRLEGESDRGMFAFADYDAAEKKCRQFNGLQRGNGFVGVVLPSFSRAYTEACAESDAREIGRAEAAGAGYRRLYDAIEAMQPHVLDVLRRRHAEIWAAVGDSTPVFFTVHQTMHLWKTNSLSRLMWARSWWSDPGADPELYRTETALGLAVHDEVKAEHIVHLWPNVNASWVARMVAADKHVWRTVHRDLDACQRSFERYLTGNGYPREADRHREITFEEACNIGQWNRLEADLVRTRDTGEYKIRPLPPTEDGEARINCYEASHGTEWRVSERDWWEGLAHRVILLTTEQVPAAVVANCTSDWRIAHLAAPRMSANEVQVHARRGVVGEKLEAVCAEFRQMHPDTFIVSNKAKAVIDSTPHVTARGSNEMIGKDVMQTMTYLTPDQYEKLQALNAWTKRCDLVGLHHVDEYNQSAGRNLGFRWDGSAKHTLLINLSLFRALCAGNAIGHARYPWQPVLDTSTKGPGPRAIGWTIDQQWLGPSGAIRCAGRAGSPLPDWRGHDGHAVLRRSRSL